MTPNNPTPDVELVERGRIVAKYIDEQFGNITFDHCGHDVFTLASYVSDVAATIASLTVEKDVLLEALCKASGHTHGLMAIRLLVERAEAAEKRVKELEEGAAVWHSYIREALGLREDEPMRFDYYATKIDNLMSAYVDGYDSAKSEYKEYLQAEYDANKLLSERIVVIRNDTLEEAARIADSWQETAKKLRDIAGLTMAADIAVMIRDLRRARSLEGK